MLTSEAVQTMGRKNVSVNGELTKKRAKEVLKSATRAAKNEIDALTGLQRVSINRVYSTGTIYAKIAIAIAQTLNIDPFYLTGEAKKRGECSDAKLNAFLAEKGYENLLAQPAKPAPKQRKNAAKTKAAEPPKESQDMPQEVNVSWVDPNPELEDILMTDTSEMTEEEASAILHSLFVQAKFSAVAHKKLEIIKQVLGTFPGMSEVTLRG